MNTIKVKITRIRPSTKGISDDPQAIVLRPTSRCLPKFATVSTPKSTTLPETQLILGLLTIFRFFLFHLCQKKERGFYVCYSRVPSFLKLHCAMAHTVPKSRRLRSTLHLYIFFHDFLLINKELQCLNIKNVLTSNIYISIQQLEGYSFMICSTKNKCFRNQ